MRFFAGDNDSVITEYKFLENDELVLTKSIHQLLMKTLMEKGDVEALDIFISKTSSNETLIAKKIFLVCALSVNFLDIREVKQYLTDLFNDKNVPPFENRKKPNYRRY